MNESEDSLCLSNTDSTLLFHCCLLLVLQGQVVFLIQGLHDWSMFDSIDLFLHFFDVEIIKLHEICLSFLFLLVLHRAITLMETQTMFFSFFIQSSNILIFEKVSFQSQYRGSNKRMQFDSMVLEQRCLKISLFITTQHVFIVAAIIIQTSSALQQIKWFILANLHLSRHRTL